jgi:DNA adenine methylase
MRSLSPLRYPGSKPNLVEYFETFLRENLLWGVDLIEPYAGSASLSLALLTSGAIRRASLVERDPLLYAFWKQIKQDPEKLCSRIRNVAVSLTTWKRMQRFLDVRDPSATSLVDLAMACVFLNRTNFSGILKAKPIGGMSQTSDYRIDCRFNKGTLIESIMAVAELAPRIDVSFGDAIGYLQRRSGSISERGALVYVDPPYYVQGRKLYRFHYGEDEHRQLAEFLDASTFKWIVSYDNHPFIRKLFKNQKVVPIWLNYVVKQSRRAQELLISNCRLLPVQYVDLGRKRGSANRQVPVTVNSH